MFGGMSSELIIETLQSSHILSGFSVSFTPLSVLYTETNCALKTIFHHLPLGSKQSGFLGTPPICIS